MKLRCFVDDKHLFRCLSAITLSIASKATDENKYAFVSRYAHAMMLDMCESHANRRDFHYRKLRVAAERRLARWGASLFRLNYIRDSAAQMSRAASNIYASRLIIKIAFI